MNILKVENIEKHFGKNGLGKTDFTVSSGEYLCITGESGCGKTTLLNIISGMLRPDGGKVFLNGKDIYGELKESSRIALRRGKIGYIMQGNTLIPELNVIHNICCPAELRGEKTDRETVDEIIERLEISNIVKSFPSEISGGEYRRVLLARILITKPEILLADEPTSNLDEKSAAKVRNILDEYASDKDKLLIISTHDNTFLSKCSRKLNIA